jgi:hypothetical protein
VLKLLLHSSGVPADGIVDYSFLSAGRVAEGGTPPLGQAVNQQKRQTK